MPKVVKSFDTWDKGAGWVFKHLARVVAARIGVESATTHAALLQEMSVMVQSWRPGALRRRQELVE